jgi:SAM-dependent methyltransferase
MLNRLYSMLVLLGINPLKIYRAFKGIPYFIMDYYKFINQAKQTGDVFLISNLYPILDDRFVGNKIASLHYFYQDLFIASRISSNNPEKHVDIGSRIDGFVAHVASFREIEVFDIRPLRHVSFPNLKFRQIDFMQENILVRDYCDSVSSLHAIEHFGLGRYGDPVDYSGHLKGLNNIYRILKPQGKFYFSVPIGEQRIEFNAHRVFSISYLLELFRDRYVVDRFSYVDDQGLLHTDVALTPQDVAANFGCQFGCGIFELTKI